MLSDLIKLLESEYGTPHRPSACVFELIIRENIAYLADDDARDSAMARLKEEIGISAESILSADSSVLRSIASHGILAENTVSKLRRIAEIALEDWEGSVERILALPKDAALRSLKKFPSIGQPGAEKILLLAGGIPLFALDSNGLRVLLRLGYGEETGNYQSTYRSAQSAALKELHVDSESLIKAHLLLRQHGKRTCKTTNPHCGTCIVREGCKYVVWEKIDTRSDITARKP